MSNKIEMDVLNKYNLKDICNWKHLQQVAIEHHYSLSNSLLITYHSIRKIQRILSKILIGIRELSSSHFIGISSTVPVHCVPTLILSIISSGNAFVYLADESKQLLLTDINLNIQYIFSSACISNRKRIIKKFIIHKQRLVLLKISKNNRQYDNMNSQNDNANYFAYAITTSGSTSGIPSIVRVTHASIMPNILDFRRIFKITDSDKIVHLTPLSFDPSIVEIFLSLSAGATLLTVSKKLRNNPYELLMLLHNSHATFLSTTPSLLLHRWSISNLKLTLLGEDSNLRILLLGGEPFPSLQVMLQMKHPDNHTRIFNIYGITEVSCWASINEIHFHNDNNDRDMIMKYNNLGTVLSNTIFQVKKQNGKDNITEGEGLLYIGSNTRICVIDNEKFHNMTLPVFRNTGDFVAIEKNGEIKFSGRENKCVKRFGIKIYLNKLESQIKILNFIEDCHVIYIQHSFSLHLFFTTIHNKKQLLTEQIKKLEQEIRDHIRKLPPIMHPDHIHYLEQFNVTERGKICKTTLKKLCEVKEYNGDIEKSFQYIWKNHLPITDDSQSCRFIDVGGTSVIALEIFCKVTDTLGNNFPELTGMLLENRTLSECTNYVINQHKKVESYSSTSLHFNEIKEQLQTKLVRNNEIPNLENICQWQRCRGKIVNSHSTTVNNSELSLNTHNDSSIKILYRHDLIKCVDASPTVFKYTASDEIFVSVGSHSGIICTVQVSNNRSWKVDLPGRIEASILVIDNYRGIVGCHDGFIYCIHLMTGEIYWKFQTYNIIKCLAVMCSQRQNIFVGSYDRFFYCISMESGSLMWKQSAASTCATPLIHDGSESVIFASLDGNCYSLDQITGKFRWKHQLPSPIFSTPTLTKNNKIVIAADVNGNIRALDINNGDELWNIHISEYIFSDLLTLYNDTEHEIESLVITTKNGNIYKYDFVDESRKCPKLVYKINSEMTIFATPWVDKPFIMIAHENGKIQMFNSSNGTLLLTFKLIGKCFSSPVFYQNLIFIGSRDNTLHILRLE